MNSDVDKGFSSIMVHLGAPGTVAVREFGGADPFVSLEVAPGVSLLCGDPEALSSFEQAVRDARQRMSALLDSVEGGLELAAEIHGSDETVEIYDPDGTVEELLESLRTDTSASEGSASQSFGVGGRS